VKSYIGAIDQGTTSTRFMVFDKHARVVAMAQKEHEQIFPAPGRVEHDAEEILRCTHEVIAVALQQRSLQPADLAAIGITNQRETTVVWERKTGRPVTNALVWQDTRVGEEVARFAKDGGQDRFRAKTGLPLSTYFSGLKLRWILENVSGARKKAADGELLFGNMMNLKTLDWDDELLAAFEIPRAMLPQVRSSSEVYGAASLPAISGVPVAGILGDQQAALVGQACFHPGEVKNTYGTGCFLLMNTGERMVPSTCGLLTTVAYKFGKRAACYALEGSVAITGALVQWLRDNLGMIARSSDVETLARTVEDNGGVYFVPAFSGLYAPYWKESARGVIAGLTRYANKGHLARAVLEATAFQTRELVEAMETDAHISLASLRVDGGMVANELLMQFQADILNREVVRPVIQETTALGAAYAAGLAVDFFPGLEQLRANWAMDRKWEPGMDKERRERLYRQWKKAVARSFDWIDS
jgi:glycerol kinase